MRALKKITFVFLWFLATWIVLAALYMFFALLLGVIPVNKNYVQAVQGTEIFISSNGVHLDIIMPVATEYLDWRHLIPTDQFSIPAACCPYIGFGWGEKNFYINTPTWADLEAGTAIKAMLWPTLAAMHVNYYRGTPQTDRHTISITLQERELELLISYIHDSFQLIDHQPVLITGAGYDMDDNFYEANGKYHLFFTSNDWVNKALKVIGVRAAVWSPFDKAVFYQLGRMVQKEKNEPSRY